VTSKLKNDIETFRGKLLMTVKFVVLVSAARIYEFFAMERRNILNY